MAIAAETCIGLRLQHHDNITGHRDVGMLFRGPLESDLAARVHAFLDGSHKLLLLVDHALAPADRAVHSVGLALAATLGARPLHLDVEAGTQLLQSQLKDRNTEDRGDMKKQGEVEATDTMMLLFGGRKMTGDMTRLNQTNGPMNKIDPRLFPCVAYGFCLSLTTWPRPWQCVQVCVWASLAPVPLQVRQITGRVIRTLRVPPL